MAVSTVTPFLIALPMLPKKLNASSIPGAPDSVD
jgi:hypothetical protein